jgi:hypothetical protein
MICQPVNFPVSSPNIRSDTPQNDILFFIEFCRKINVTYPSTWPDKKCIAYNRFLPMGKTTLIPYGSIYNNIVKECGRFTTVILVSRSFYDMIYLTAIG